MPRHKSTNPEAGISCANYLGPETEMQVKYIENYKTFKLTSCMEALNIST
jgi:hypothetical protein